MSSSGSRVMLMGSALHVAPPSPATSHEFLCATSAAVVRVAFSRCSHFFAFSHWIHGILRFTRTRLLWPTAKLIIYIHL